MKNFKNSLCVLAVSLAVTMVGRAQSPACDESGLWQLWVTCSNSAYEHTSVVAACRDFRVKAPREPLGIVVAGWEAWHLLKLGDTNAAIALFEPMMAVTEKSSCLQAAGIEMARNWLTRLDREKVRGALKKIYLRDIAFPASLESLKSLKNFPIPPLTDRWGKPWEYRLECSLKGMNNQQYVLESTRLGSRSDLASMLALPYANDITLDPIRLSSANADTVEFSNGTGKSAFLQAGSTFNGNTVAYLGEKIIVLADENHWRVVLMPRQ